LSAVFLRNQQAGHGVGLIGRAPLLSGDAGIEQTVQVMRQLVDEALADPDFVNQAVSIVSSAPAHDEIAEIKAIYSWVARNIRFVKDPVTKEKLYPPQQLLQIGAGDCDDISMLTAALLMAVGYPARLVTVAAQSDAPTEFSHVYAEAEVPPGSGNWLPVDSARPDSQFGLAPSRYFRKRAWSLTDSGYSDLSGQRTRLSGLSGYLGLGDDSCDGSTPVAVNLTPLFQTVASQIPTYIAEAQGGAIQSTPTGTVSYTPPGYLTPAAGYGLQSSSSLSSLLPLLLLGGLVFLVMR
jgi:hypothetical protein